MRRSKGTFRMGTLCSSRSSCGRYPAWPKPVNLKFSLLTGTTFLWPTPLPSDSKLGVQFCHCRLRWTSQWRPCPSQWHQSGGPDNKIMWILASWPLLKLCIYLGEGDSYTEISKRTISLFCHFVHLGKCTLQTSTSPRKWRTSVQFCIAFWTTKALESGLHLDIVRDGKERGWNVTWQKGRGQTPRCNEGVCALLQKIPCKSLYIWYG